jgi:hypothetical protein
MARPTTNDMGRRLFLPVEVPVVNAVVTVCFAVVFYPYLNLWRLCEAVHFFLLYRRVERHDDV